MEKLTSLESISNETDLIINNFRDSLLELNGAAIEYMNIYNEYAEKNIVDASIIKEKMKMSVLKAVQNDEF